MSETKRFLEAVSVQMGRDGEVTMDVALEARRILLTSGPKKCNSCGRFLGQHSQNCPSEEACQKNSLKD